MSDIAKAIDGVVKDGIAPILKGAGFKKTARNYHLVQPESIAVVNVQASQWNDGQEGRFTLNIGRYYPEIDRRARSRIFTGLPKTHQCTICRRIGSLMPSDNDVWWTVKAECGNEQIVMQTCEVVRTYALSWLTRNESIAGLSASIAGEASFDAASIFIALRDKENASVCLKRLLSVIPTDWQRIELWAHGHGIDLT